MPQIKPGWYRFKGQRFTPSGKWMVTMDEPVRIVPGARPGTYTVLHSGSATKYSAQLYDGEWTRLEWEDAA